MTFILSFKVKGRKRCTDRVTISGHLIC